MSTFIKGEQMVPFLNKLDVRCSVFGNLGILCFLTKTRLNTFFHIVRILTKSGMNFSRHVQIKVKYKLKLILADFTFQWAPSPRANKWFPFWTSWMWDAPSLEIMISTLVLTLWWAMWRKQIFLGKKIKLKFVKWLNVELHFGIWRKNRL